MTLRWRPARLLLVVADVTLVGLVVAVALRSTAALAIVAPELLWLAWCARRPTTVDARVTVGCWPRRCEEGQDVEAALEVAGLPVGTRVQTISRAESGASLMEQTPGSWRWRVPAEGWGRNRTPLRVRLLVTSRGGLWVAGLVVAWPAVDVVPRSTPSRQAVDSARVRSWPGPRTARVTGPGLEPVGVAPYVSGMPVRRVNWRQTRRHHALHVTTFAAERAQDLVLVVDALLEAGPTGDTCVDRAARGAASLARAQLDAGDRVGLVTITPALDWIPPGLGYRQLIRLQDALMALRDRDSVVSPDLGRLPPSAVPHGSLVVLFTPLLTEQSVAVAGDLRRRGHPVLIVDTVSGEPPVSNRRGSAGTALRLWRLDRATTRLALQDRGIRVVQWPREESIGTVLARELAPGSGAAGPLRGLDARLTAGAR